MKNQDNIYSTLSIQSPILQNQSSPQYQQHVSVQPVPIPLKSTHSNTFVHKLYNMVIDTLFQHLIAWNYTGASFIVCNIMEFSRDVLPKHFKHNNFSSFVRQLNMYGFHKVNKSPRGHRTLAENQIWEFSHTNFLRDRPDLLDDIKRKTIESDTVRRETGDLHAHMAMLQVSQSDLLQQINHLYENFDQIVKELEETKQNQGYQANIIKSVVNYISQQNGGQTPAEIDKEYKRLGLDNSATATVIAQQPPPPSIFVTSHQEGNSNNSLLSSFYNPTASLTQITQSPLVVPTQQNASNLMTLPPSPSPSLLLSDDDNSSYYSMSSNQNNASPRHRSISNFNNNNNSIHPSTAASNNLFLFNS